ncbi:ABC transporter ATP-binding protein/permease [Alterileibacterium massiliense]|uniref:ABC transporter ATP-binding protein/permease n=1 Tax=Alterileibacterium massiliense TaxID=1870997 RepID=UPI0008DA1AAC|nr:ABC transporter ATP-binding protein [Alterileibacterium massiliense]
MANHMIELKKASKFYSNKDTVSTGFSRVDLMLDIGEFVAITGESGSGKSTLLNVISGLDTYEEGEMYVAGQDTSAFQVEDYEAYRKKYIGNIFQDFNLVNSYTVYQNIELVMLISGKRKNECKEKIEELIDLVGLSEFKNAKVSKLSGGQKQRVAIARALAKDAPIIVADEPTGNLDSKSADLVIKTLKKVSRSKLVIIVTHNYEQVEEYITRKITMHDGKIIEDRKLKTSQDMRDMSEGFSSYLDLDSASSSGASNSEAPNSGEQSSEVLNSDVLNSEASGSASDAPTSEASNLEGRRTRRQIKKRQIDSESKVSEDSIEIKSMNFGSQLNLGMRNTFNIFSKFMLLLIVYLFISTAVTNQYASTKASITDMDKIGYNQYFADLRRNRVIVTKEDGTYFTPEEVKEIEKNELVDHVVNNDVQLDTLGAIPTEQAYINGPVRTYTGGEKINVKYGKLPENDNEVMIAVYNDHYQARAIKKSAKDMIGKEYYLDGVNEGEELLTSKVKIVGIAFINRDKNAAQDSFETGRLYVNSNTNKIIASRMLARQSDLLMDYNGKMQEIRAGEGSDLLRPSANVSKGKAYIFESHAGYYKNGEALYKPLNITSNGLHETNNLNLTVGKVVNSENAKKALGIEKDFFEEASTHIYINEDDYYDLYSNENYQVSAFAKNEKDVKELSDSLSKSGYKVLPIKESLTNPDRIVYFVLRLLQLAIFMAMIIVLFFISYAVIRLIMKSRNTYYSTLRILGAKRNNASNIMKIELIAMAMISYVLNIIFVLLVNKDILKIPILKNNLSYISPLDFIILLAILIILSLLIARRYSRKMFSKSAMNAYREEI